MRRATLCSAAFLLLLVGPPGCGPDVAPAVCGDDRCELGRGESPLSCAADCRFDCGNGVCEYDRGENADRCVADCGWRHLSTGGGNTPPAIRNDGTIWTLDPYGIGTYQDPHRPSFAIDDASSLSGDGDNGCLVDSSGGVACWGYLYSALVGGSGTSMETFTTPQQILVPETASQVEFTMGIFHNGCVLATSGRVYCWGDNTFGEVGDGSTERRARPTQVLDLDDATKISVSEYTRTNACALMRSGSVRCWGDNSYGQLGIGDTYETELCHFGHDDSCSSRPLTITSLGPARDIGAGFNNVVCAVLVDGTVWCWGQVMGFLFAEGDPALETCGINSFSGKECVPSPVQVAEIDDAVSVSVGIKHACVIRSDRTVACFGLNQPLGLDGDPSPVTMPNLTGVIELNLGGGSSCALTDQAQIWCWTHWDPLPARVPDPLTQW